MHRHTEGPMIVLIFCIVRSVQLFIIIFLFFYSSLDDNFHNITNNYFYNKSMSDWHQNKDDPIWVRTKQKSINKFCDDGSAQNYAILFAQLAITFDCV